MGMTGSDAQTIAFTLSGVGVWVGEGTKGGVGDGTKVGVGRLGAIRAVGAAVETCSDAKGGWQDASDKARLRSRIFINEKRISTWKKEDNRILSLLIRLLEEGKI